MNAVFKNLFKLYAMVIFASSVVALAPQEKVEYVDRFGVTWKSLPEREVCSNLRESVFQTRSGKDGWSVPEGWKDSYEKIVNAGDEFVIPFRQQATGSGINRAHARELFFKQCFFMAAVKFIDKETLRSSDDDNSEIHLYRFKAVKPGAQKIEFISYAANLGEGEFEWMEKSCFVDEYIIVVKSANGEIAE
jgi:hypothetical protein